MHQPQRPRFDLQRWLARLSYSFIIFGAVLLWRAYHLLRNGAESPEPRTWQIALYGVAGVVSLMLGVAGIRARHQPRERDHSEIDD